MPKVKAAHMDSPLSWETLTRLEPRLVSLRKQASEAANQSKGNVRLLSFYKKGLERLVGWERPAGGPHVLHTDEAYDIAFREVLGGW